MGVVSSATGFGAGLAPYIGSKLAGGKSTRFHVLGASSFAFVAASAILIGFLGLAGDWDRWPLGVLVGVVAAVVLGIAAARSPRGSSAVQPGTPQRATPVS